MHPPRFRLRTLMLAVAAVAVFAGGAKMWRRSEAFRRRATREGWQEKSWKRSEQGWLEILRQTEAAVRGGPEENRALFKPEADYFRTQALICAEKASH